MVRLSRDRHREVVDEAGRRGWHILGGYLRGITIVALIDAVGIGVALVLIGVPLPFALALLTFRRRVRPRDRRDRGRDRGHARRARREPARRRPAHPRRRVVVQQVEGNLLQPLIMGRSLELHPLAIAWALSVGAVLYGIAGSIISVPLTAAVYAVGARLAGRGAEQEEEPAVWDRLARLRRRAGRRGVGSRKVAGAAAGRPPLEE